MSRRRPLFSLLPGPRKRPPPAALALSVMGILVGLVALGLALTGNDNQRALLLLFVSLACSMGGMIWGLRAAQE